MGRSSDRLGAMFLQASTTVPATKAASSSVGDPGSTRVVYLIVVVLILLAIGLGWFAYTFWRRTRPGSEPARRTDPRRAEPTRSPTGRSGARQWWDDDDVTPPHRQRPVEPPPRAQRPPAGRSPAQRPPAQRTPAQRPSAPRDPLL